MSPIPIIVLVAIGASLLAGGSLRAFERLRVHWWALAPAGLALQAAPVPGFARFDRETVATAIMVASYGALMAVVIVNRRLPGASVMLIGLALNLAVIAPNGGMPVDPGALRVAGATTATTISGDAKHHLRTDTDVWAFLGDTIPIPPPARVIVSIGDVLLYAGLAWLVVSAMLGRAQVNSRPPARWFQMYRGKHLTRERRGLPPARHPPHVPAEAARWGIAR